MKQSAVFISMGFTWVIRISIHACICCTIVIISFGHQVSFVFTCPSRGTHVTTWYHNLWGAFGHVTHGTWDVMVVQAVGIYTIVRRFVFSSVYSGIITSTRFSIFIDGFTCQTHIIRSPTSDLKMRSSNVTYKTIKLFPQSCKKLRVCAWVARYMWDPGMEKFEKTLAGNVKQLQEICLNEDLLLKIWRKP
jgi:hypothetical protein